MKKAIRFEEELHDVKTSIISTIQEHLEAAKAQDVSLKGNSIVLEHLMGYDDQFSPSIQRVTTKGVVAEISYGEEENYNFEDLSNVYLIAVLEKLENNEFEIFEEEPTDETKEN